MKELCIHLPLDNEQYVKSLRYKIAYISKDIQDITEQGAKLFIKVSEEKAAEIEAAIFRLVEETSESYIDVPADVIFEHKSGHKFPEYDIYEALLSNQWVVPYENGLVGFGKQFLNLYRYLDQTFVQWAEQHGAVEYVYPDLISIDTLNQYHYIAQFPNHLMFASHLKEDIELIQDFSSEVSAGCDCYNSSYIDKPTYANKLAICPHVYKQYENQAIDPEQPIIVTSAGKCKRFESINMTKVERLLDFTMREIVLVGSYEYVLKLREEFIQLTEDLIRRIDLQANIKTGNDPFFTTEYEPKALLQQKLKLKYELNMLLPYSGKELSVGSFNYHGTYFAEAFNITSTDGSNVHTGCIAFGLERFVYAILSQIGLEQAQSVTEGQNERQFI
ncbi:aminoacyl--tRNA ligase-related protein [Paenibacillus aceti]|uniref:aminoacyl--tRNA ligase-related protein n=1 Tax=Paenibacillus aceti TaxID=1820010 RepID=UPI0013C45DFA|nr:aminoacyl--tRNA ligase-related protein [Paenibacillus aceti]